MDEDARGCQAKKTDELRGRGDKVQSREGIDYDRDGGPCVHEAAEIDLAQGDDEAGVDGQEEHEIHFAGAHVFRNLGAVGQEKGLENLLNEMARADEQHDLPLRPVADEIGVGVNDGDEGELKTKPEQFDKNPKEEVGFKT